MVYACINDCKIASRDPVVPINCHPDMCSHYYLYSLPYRVNDVYGMMLSL